MMAHCKSSTSRNPTKATTCVRPTMASAPGFPLSSMCGFKLLPSSRFSTVIRPPAEGKTLCWSVRRRERHPSASCGARASTALTRIQNQDTPSGRRCTAAVFTAASASRLRTGQTPPSIPASQLMLLEVLTLTSTLLSKVCLILSDEIP
ncbi:hypothetical protein GWK47_020019 [Chionoecetes opilio]|uniref:Uncharacterized protein n=1 Tax=Chionoecetes opilio TaxID=41210 RepID=A0A8J5CHS1_CHIOP|nr:hypothetical protein GWK47_020019 [Chionoecetes opilio]